MLTSLSQNLDELVTLYVIQEQTLSVETASVAFHNIILVHMYMYMYMYIYMSIYMSLHVLQ